jgi:hypothetical protein
MKTFSTKSLITLLIIVLGIYFALDYFDSGESTEKIPALLAEFDLKAVDEAKISQEGNTLRIYRDSEKIWRLDMGAFQPKADSQIVLRGLNNIASLKPTRIISKNAGNFSQYQVDSTGIRAQLFSKGKKICDVYIGGLLPSGRELMSYVRAENSPITYSVAGFASESVTSRSYIYRPKTLSSCFADSIEKIVCQFEGAPAFEMIQIKPKYWEISKQKCDSSVANTWASGLESLSSTDFADGFALEQNIGTVKIYLKNAPKLIELNLFENQSKKRALVSSLNPESIFEAEKLFDKAFKNKKDLVK